MLEKSKLYKRREDISDLPYEAEGLLDNEQHLLHHALQTAQDEGGRGQLEQGCKSSWLGGSDRLCSIANCPTSFPRAHPKNECQKQEFKEGVAQNDTI